MKVFAVLPCVATAVDDSATLLSLKVATTLETGVDHLLDAVGSRNVTQMSSLLQNLVEETITDGPYELDGDVKAALSMIKDVLVADIRGALKEQHCTDQVSCGAQIMHCFENCENTKKAADADSPYRCNGKDHTACRQDLLGLYKEHITACRGLDSFVKTFNDKNCPMKKDKDCCLLPHTSWNCNCENKAKVEKMAVDNSMGEWLEENLAIFKDAHANWVKHFKACKKSYRKYIEKDAKCDCLQSECEAANCGYDQYKWGNCDGIYNSCWNKCQKLYDEAMPACQCKEKDRKIDWSATEKIECYVNVLLEAPSKDQLLKVCGTEDCYSKYREMMYLKCNEICVTVDYDGEWDEYPLRDEIKGDERKGVEHEGKIRDQRTHLYGDIKVSKKNTCRTMHRAGPVPKDGIANPDGGPVTFEGGRCTSHLDICYPEAPCCEPCAQCESTPCEGKMDEYKDGHADDKKWDTDSYVYKMYGQYNFLSQRTVCGMEDTDICHAELEHTFAYAYNLCECIDCPDKQHFPDAVCGGKNACPYAGGGYDYSQHHLTGVKCSA
jgi:hypothetical protein